MRAGDTLYLPRGWLHQAMTSDTASLHLTVGRRRRHVARRRSGGARRRPRRRRSTCAGAFPRTDEPRTGSSSALRPGSHPRPSRPGRAARSCRAGAPCGRTPSTSCERSTSWTSTTPLERRETVIFDLAVDEQEATLSLRRAASSAFRRGSPRSSSSWPRRRGRSRLADLPGRLDDAGRLVLGRRLVREGFLRISPE